MRGGTQRKSRQRCCRVDSRRVLLPASVKHIGGMPQKIIDAQVLRDNYEQRYGLFHTRGQEVSPVDVGSVYLDEGRILSIFALDCAACAHIQQLPAPKLTSAPLFSRPDFVTEQRVFRVRQCFFFHLTCLFCSLATLISLNFLCVASL